MLGPICEGCDVEATITQTYRRLWHEHWWWQVRRQIVMEAARQALTRNASFRQPGARPNLFEVGCGGGHSFDELSQLGAIQGVEPDSIMIGEDNPWRAQITGAFFGRDFPCTEEFDLILALDVLEHIEDDRGAVDRVTELLAPGGRFLVTVPALPCLWSLHDVAHHHFRRYTRASLSKLLCGAGLRIEHIRYCFGWSLPLVWMRRWVVTGDATKYEVKIPPRWLNSVFGGMTRAEEAACGWLGVSPLWGSTLLAVACREDELVARGT